MTNLKNKLLDLGAKVLFVGLITFFPINDVYSQKISSVKNEKFYVGVGAGPSYTKEIFTKYSQKANRFNTLHESHFVLGYKFHMDFEKFKFLNSIDISSSYFIPLSQAEDYEMDSIAGMTTWSCILKRQFHANLIIKAEIRDFLLGVGFAYQKNQYKLNSAISNPNTPIEVHTEKIFKPTFLAGVLVTDNFNIYLRAEPKVISWGLQFNVDPIYLSKESRKRRIKDLKIK